MNDYTAETIKLCSEINGVCWECVSFAPFKRYYTPSWDDMCRIKNIFF